MANQKCLHCALINFADAVACRRCKAALLRAVPDGVVRSRASAWHAARVYLDTELISQQANLNRYVSPERRARIVAFAIAVAVPVYVGHRFLQQDIRALTEERYQGADVASAALWASLLYILARALIDHLKPSSAYAVLGGGSIPVFCALLFVSHLTPDKVLAIYVFVGWPIFVAYRELRGGKDMHA